ncbi:DUF488 domain-containing protein [Xanthobacter sp. TB0139]|uniref:DUF488 domain-containing protein n=1 Tax=Xanthobacter sp. TB0139 TaxID=3459178 RepID=UPI004038FC8D
MPAPSGKMLHVKRIYEPAGPDDGFRILVDRVWPRGMSHEKAHLELWLKEIAPSTELRQWFGHLPERWEVFRQRYLDELRTNTGAVATLRGYMERGPVTLLYSAQDEAHNQALVLRDYLLAEA